MAFFFTFRLHFETEATLPLRHGRAQTTPAQQTKKNLREESSPKNIGNKRKSVQTCGQDCENTCGKVGRKNSMHPVLLQKWWPKVCHRHLHNLASSLRRNFCRIANFFLTKKQKHTENVEKRTTQIIDLQGSTLMAQIKPCCRRKMKNVKQDGHMETSTHNSFQDKCALGCMWKAKSIN